KTARKADALVGTVVNGKYKIRALVAAGGMGKIYEAEQIALGRPVALKILHTHAEGLDGDDDPQFKKRFLREASILARLQHPNIVTVFDYGAIEGAETERYFISMEFCAGETLARRISDRFSLATRDTIRIVRQIARGLTEAHAMGVIHRDLKPSNVMLLPGRDGEELVKIVDFGIVKIVGDDSQEKEDLTQEGSFIGSPKYMAPEQITRGGKIDARTDIYSFGIILYQCLTGTVPFDGASSIQTLMAHLNQSPQPMRERAPTADIPDWLEQLVMGCIEKDPEKRPQTMDAVAKTLAEAEAALTSSRLLAAMSTRNSSPTLSGSVESVPMTSRSETGPRLPSGITTQGTISSVRPAHEETEKTRTSPGMKKEGAKKRSPMLLAFGGAAALLLGTGAFFGLRHHEPPVQAAPIAPPAPAPPLPSAPAHFTLLIESVPPGADVREGDRVLGTTPLDLSIDNEAVRNTPRAFVLAKDGFMPYAVGQGASAENVHVVAPLVAIPAAAAPSVPAHVATLPASGAGRRGTVKTPPPTQSAAPTTSHPDLEIRMNR
ncbi:MAG: serine/threonine-protein kinase, partial [Polyangiaceae bacterium]